MIEKNDNVLAGVECPNCGSQGPFKLVVTVRGTATVSDDGWDDLCSEESDFDDGAPARCSKCGHEAAFSTFYAYVEGGTEDLMGSYEHASGNTVKDGKIFDVNGTYICDYNDDLARGYLDACNEE